VPSLQRRRANKLTLSLGLIPIYTPGFSQQSNCTLKYFVNTFKHDYTGTMNLSDATSFMSQSGAAFLHFDKVQPPFIVENELT